MTYRWAEWSDVGFATRRLHVRVRNTRRWRPLFSERNAVHVWGPVSRSRRGVILVSAGRWLLGVQVGRRAA